jgi:Ca2+-transporting ATPase
MLPVQILWVNLVQDSIPTIALAFDKGDPENMHEPPRKRFSVLIDRHMSIIIFCKSVLSNIALFAIFIYYWQTTQDIVLTRTIVFVGLGIDTLFYIFSVRSLHRMVWKTNIVNNPYVLISVFFGWAMLFLAVYAPALQRILHTVPLQLDHWTVLMFFGIGNLLLFETVKWGYKKFHSY